MFIIPLGTQQTVWVSGGVFKHVTCEKCGAEYVYRLERTGTARNTSFFTTQRGLQRAADKARENLTDLLASGIDAVPCPQCGRAQEHMFPAARKMFGIWLNWLGAIMICVGAVLHLPCFFWAQKHGFGFLGMSMAGICAAGLCLLIYRPIRARFWDPNSSPKTCKALSATAAKRGVWTRQEFEALVAQAREQQVRELDQLVSRNKLNTRASFIQSPETCEVEPRGC